jgi:hypothetical protein
VFARHWLGKLHEQNDSSIWHLDETIATCLTAGSVFDNRHRLHLPEGFACLLDICFGSLER